jgi:hypothetical protein
MRYNLRDKFKDSLWSVEMQIHVSWHNQAQRVLLVTFPKEWGWDEFGVAYREAVEMTHRAGGYADVIVDMRQVNRLPAHALRHAVRVASRWPNHFEDVVFVTNQPILIAFGQAAHSIIPRARKQAHHTSTIGQAAALLDGQRVGVTPYSIS